MAKRKRKPAVPPLRQAPKDAELLRREILDRARAVQAARGDDYKLTPDEWATLKREAAIDVYGGLTAEAEAALRLFGRWLGPV